MTWPLRLLPARKSVLAVPSWAAEWPYGLRGVASDLLLRPPVQQYRAHPARAAVRHPSQRGDVRREGTGEGRGVERWRRGTLRVQRCGRPRGGTRTRPAPPLRSHDSMAATASLALTAA